MWALIVIAVHVALLLLRRCVRLLLFRQRADATGAVVDESGTAATPSRRRVAVIGGGIAGTAAAWTLRRSGRCDVTLFEARDVLGGNAKTHVWPDQVRTGLSVLAWPPQYFRHYELLLHTLGIPVTTAQPKFAVSVDHRELVFAQGEANLRWRVDMCKWDRMVAFIRRVNNGCTHTSAMVTRLARLLWRMLRGGMDPFPVPAQLAPSFYEVSLFNPMNVLPARKLARHAFGISDEFWNQVVVPVYSSSFLTAALDQLPALIIPALDDIISVGAKEPLKPLHTWRCSSKDVFDRLADQIGRENIVLDAQLLSVAPSGPHRRGAPERWDVVYADGAKRASFDSVIFACPATAVDVLTAGSSLRSPLFNAIIPQVTYENQRDANFVAGFVHTDREVLPKKCCDALLEGRYTNYVRVVGEPALGNLENTFVLGTWVPSAVFAPASSEQPDTRDRYVTYNPSAERNLGEQQVVGSVDNSWAHPQFTLKNLLLGSAVRLLQGRRAAYYCASYTTPGNGHDLSLLSGIIVGVEAAGGACYPFEGTAEPETVRDYRLLRSFLGFS